MTKYSAKENDYFRYKYLKYKNKYLKLVGIQRGGRPKEEDRRRIKLALDDLLSENPKVREKGVEEARSIKNDFLGPRGVSPVEDPNVLVDRLISDLLDILYQPTSVPPPVSALGAPGAAPPRPEESELKRRHQEELKIIRTLRDLHSRNKEVLNRGIETAESILFYPDRGSRGVDIDENIWDHINYLIASLENELYPRGPSGPASAPGAPGAGK
jgi:hypothetical protein